ncbi:MAG: hypothetical protein QXF26_07950 [Candidatus Bathyarchaeia archaeon]
MRLLDSFAWIYFTGSDRGTKVKEWGRWADPLYIPSICRQKLNPDT